MDYGNKLDTIMADLQWSRELEPLERANIISRLEDVNKIVKSINTSEEASLRSTQIISMIIFYYLERYGICLK